MFSPAEDANTGSLCLKALSKWELYMGVAKNLGRAAGSPLSCFSRSTGDQRPCLLPALLVGCSWKGLVWLLFTSCGAAALHPHSPACFPTLISHPEPLSVRACCCFKECLFLMCSVHVLLEVQLISDMSSQIPAILSDSPKMRVQVSMQGLISLQIFPL